MAPGTFTTLTVVVSRAPLRPPLAGRTRGRPRRPVRGWSESGVGSVSYALVSLPFRNRHSRARPGCRLASLRVPHRRAPTRLDETLCRCPGEGRDPHPPPLVPRTSGPRLSAGEALQDGAPPRTVLFLARSPATKQSRGRRRLPARDCFASLARKRDTFSPQFVADVLPFSYRAGRPPAGVELAMTLDLTLSAHV